MNSFNTIEIKENVLADNDREAAELREKLKKQGTFLLNLMSSPGAGKTTVVVDTVKALKDEMKIAVMEADIDSDIDARRVTDAGAKAVQLHTGGMCHLDADMTRQGLEGIDTESADLVILENVGNLVCPAEFDTGSSRNVMILSVPEGDDKPLKYPLMFKVSDVMLINKIDTLPMFDFDMEQVTERAKRVNPDIEIFRVSAKTGEGMEQWYTWLCKAVSDWNSNQ